MLINHKFLRPTSGTWHWIGLTGWRKWILASCAELAQEDERKREREREREREIGRSKISFELQYVEITIIKDKD